MTNTSVTCSKCAKEIQCWKQSDNKENDYI